MAAISRMKGVAPHHVMTREEFASAVKVEGQPARLTYEISTMLVDAWWQCSTRAMRQATTADEIVAQLAYLFPGLHLYLSHEEYLCQVHATMRRAAQAHGNSCPQPPVLTASAVAAAAAAADVQTDRVRFWGALDLFMWCIVGTRQQPTK